MGLGRSIVLGLTTLALSLNSHAQENSLETISYNEPCDTSRAIGDFARQKNPRQPIKNLEELDSRYNYNEKDLKRFNKMVGYTLQESKADNKNAIIVDKAAYTLYLIENGELHSKYPIGLGFNPYDDKQKEGDGCTPEGFYEVMRKKDRGQTLFGSYLFAP